MDKLLSRKLECCRSELVELNKLIGTAACAFILDFEQPKDWLGRNWLSSFKRRSSVIFSSSQVEVLFARSRSSMTQLDPDLVKSCQNKIHIWLADKSLKQQQLKCELLKELGYCKQISVSFMLPNFDGLKGCYSFFYDVNYELTDEQRIKLINEHMTQIEMTGSHIASEGEMSGPFQDYRIIKPSTVSIIQHLAEGYSRKDLSDIHFMSARGVDYHIEKAKLTLDAKNTSHLIHVAHKVKLI